MKKVLQYLLIVAITATVALAGIKPDMTPATQSKDEYDIKKMAVDALNDVQLYDSNLLPTGGGLKAIDGGVYINAGSTNLYNMSPMVYEPKSGYIFMVNSVRVRPEGTQVLSGRMDIHYSTDNGATWNTYTLHEMQDGFWGYPSLAVMNPDGATNIEDMKLYVFAVRWKYDEMQQSYPFTGMHYLILDKSLQSTVIDDIIEQGPTSNNSGYTWNFVKTAHFDGAGKQTVLNYGTLSPDEFSQYGVYGVGYWNWQGGGVNYGSSIPIGWDVKQFRPSPALGSSYNAAPEIDFDDQGNAYCAVFNMSANNIDKRVPAVSVSNDDGITWSEFDFMPSKIMEDFVVENDGILVSSDGGPVTWAPGSMAYGTYGFAVTGVNEYSYVFRASIFTSDTTSTPMIIEASRKDNVWSVRKVADMNYVSYFYFAYFDMEGNATASSLYGLPILRDSEFEPWRDSIYSNPRHLELQLSKTKDGKSVVIKYIDVPEGNEANVIDPAHILNDGRTLLIGEDTWPQPLTEIQNDDIFIGYRNIDGGDWNVSNVTQNNIYYKQTWIPKIVPSITEIPLITSRTIRPSVDSGIGASEYPEQLLWYFAGGGVNQQAMFAMIDPTDGQPIDDFVNSVEVNENVSFDIKTIYPNPSTNSAEVVFNTNAYGNVNLALYDAQGNKVQNIANTNLPAGIHAVTIKDLSKLSSGAYYVTMTFNGVVISKPLNVVK